MTTPEPSDDRTEWDADATLSGGPPLDGLLSELTPDELEDFRQAVAGIGGGARRASSCPTRLESLGPYRDLEEIGRGGMGVVYRAIEPATGEPVAVKVPSPGLAEVSDARRRFLLEAEVVGRLKHPGVVPHIKSGEDRGRWYIVSEFCDGPNLEVWLKHRKAPVPPREAARLIRILADAVEHAHGRNVLHRDVKPSNILLPGAKPTSDAEELSARLTDFGLAKLIDSGLETLAGQTQAATGTGVLIGSPPYMAPELASGGKAEIDRRTDVYGLGAVLYELLTGRPPFRGENSTETLLMVLHEEPIPVRVLRPGAPKPLETIALQCLEKDPDRRYKTAGDLRDDLERYLSGRRILAKPLGAVERVRRWSHRRPRTALGLTASLALVLLLIGGVAASNLWLRRIVEEARVAQASADRNARTSRLQTHASRLQLARRAFDDRQVGRAQMILMDLAPTSGEDDLRGFSWRYLWQTMRREARIFPGHGLETWRSRLSPDERLLASGTNAGALEVDDLDRERVVWVERLGPNRVISQLAFSPDGSLLAAAVVEVDSEEPDRPLSARVEVRRATTGELVGASEARAGRWALALEFVAPRRLVIGYEEPHEGGRDVRAPRPSRFVPCELRGGRIVQAGDEFAAAWAAASRDGGRIAAVGPDGRLGILDLGAGAWVATFPDVDPTEVGPVQFSDDGLRLAVSRPNTRDVLIFDATTGARLRRVGGFAGPPAEVAFQPGGEALLARDAAQEVRLIPPEGGAGIRLQPPTAEPGVATKHMAFTPDGSRVLVHRSEFRGADRIELRSAADGVLIAESPGRLMGMDGTWQIRRARGPELIYGTGRYLWTWSLDRPSPPPPPAERAHGDEVWAVAYSPDGTVRATAGNNDRDRLSIKLWDARTGRLIREIDGGEATVSDLDFSPDGRLLATASLAVRSPFRLWDVAEGRELAALDLPDAETARAVAFDVEGRRVYIGGDQGTVVAWDVERRAEAWSVRPPEKRRKKKTHERIHDLAVSPDGLRLAIVNDDGDLRVHEAADGRVVARFTAPAATYAVAYSLDGRRLAVADYEGSIHVLDAATASTLHTIHSDEGEIRSLAFGPDGRTLASGGLGRVVQLWDPETGDELLTLTGHEAQINAVAFSPDGDTLVSADHIGVVRFWRTREDALR